MDKKLKNQKSEKKDYYNEPANKWLREYLEYLNKDGYGYKTTSDTRFAEKCGIIYSRIKGIASGNTKVNANDIIKISKASGISANKILGLEEEKIIPNIYKVDTNKGSTDFKVDIFSESVYTKLSEHILMEKNQLFPIKDDYLKFLEWLILDENYLKNIMDKSDYSLDLFRKDIKTIDISEKILIFNQKSFDSFKTTIKKNDNLNDQFKKIITDTKLRNETRDFIYRYIFNNIKNNPEDLLIEK